MSRVAALLVVLCIAGCANRFDTPSGSPEVTIAGVRPEQVKPALVNAVLNRRLRIKQDTAYLLVVEKDTENIAATVFLSTGFSGAPVERFSFAIAEVSGGTRIVADATFVSNAGTAYEQAAVGRTALNTPELQNLLNEVAGQVRPAAPLPVAPATPSAARR